MPHIQYYMVVDLEATCSNDGSLPKSEMETIEIGAVMVEARTHQIIEEYETFIRPVRNPELTDFCRELTSITQYEVDGAPSFQEAFADFVDWANEFPEFIFCSWGYFDRSQFEKDCAFHGIEYPFGDRHINLKEEFVTARSLKKKSGVIAALRSVGLSFKGKHHRGIDDARNIADLIPYIYPLG